MSDTSITLPEVHMTTRVTRHSNPFDNLLKRVFDVLVAAFSLLLLSPVIALIALLIKRNSPGPVFYRGLRAARWGGAFQILKFRTMFEHPDSYNGPPVTSEDDPRITQLGKWLRNSKLNELPQLWNVLMGEMSLVGPRPEDPEIAAGWPEEVRAEILSIRPGITSPASILYRNEESLLENGHVMQVYVNDIQPSKMRLDQLYVRHRSFWGDLDILFWTALVLTPQVRSFSPPEGSLFLGPIARGMSRHMSWFVIDTLITLAAIGVTGLIWRSFGPLDLGWGPALVLALGFSILFSATNAILGVNRIRWAKAPAMDALDMLPGVVLATVVAILTNYFLPTSFLSLFYEDNPASWQIRPLLPNAMILTASALAFFGFVLVRYRTRVITGLATRWVRWRGVRTAQERVLIIGGGESGQYASWIINNGKYAKSLRVVGYVDDDLYKQGIRIRGVNVLGGRSDIPKLVKKADIGIIIFAIHNISALERNQLLRTCDATDAQVMVFPDIPAALSQLARNGKQIPVESGEIDKGLADETGPLLPCNICLNKVTPLRVDRWLAQLETQAAEGDLESILIKLHELRRHVRSDAEEQLRVNISSDRENVKENTRP